MPERTIDTVPSPILRFVPEAVAQHDLDLILGLDAEISSLIRRRDAHCVRAIQRVLDGVPVAAGAHTVSVEQSPSGSGVTFRLVIDGRAIG